MIKLSVQTHGKKDAPGFLPADLIKNFAAYTGRQERSEEKIEAMVESLLRNGQEQNFTWRKGFNDEPIPITGHTRILAADHINKRRLSGKVGGSVEVKFGPDNPFIVYGVYKQCNELEAIIHTFTENDDETRTPLNDIDIANLIRTLSDTFSLSDSTIAEKLGKQPSWVSTHRALLDLDTETQAKVASGELKFSHAQAVLKVDPNERKNVIATAKENGKLTAAGINAAARASGAKTKGTAARSLSDLKMDLKPLADGNGPFKVQALALWDYLAGRGTLTDALAGSDQKQATA